MELVYRTRIVGEYLGWDPSKVYELADGSFWQMTGRHQFVDYGRRYSPPVKLYASNERYFLQLEGDKRRVTVRCVDPGIRLRVLRRQLADYLLRSLSKDRIPSAG